ncbi:hypothetical protein ACIO53_05585 [Streptomyces sp. NPDC087305]|uniref:hypothetical protein n=1 Tax=Streptomyces sp. NPDC087305 TaxID=3365781 RepID=UPI0038036782
MTRIPAFTRPALALAATTLAIGGAALAPRAAEATTSMSDDDGQMYSHYGSPSDQNPPYGNVTGSSDDYTPPAHRGASSDTESD